MGSGISRRGALVLGLLAWLVGVPFVFGVLPWGISHVGARHGWSAGQPGTWNDLGLIPLALGTALLAWVAVTQLAHSREWPDRMNVDWTPKLLLQRGPYGHSRNPMYLGERVVWLGWTVFYGSVALAVGLAVIAVGQALIVRREERELEARFGEAYLEYRRAVPRWIGRRARSAGAPSSR